MYSKCASLREDACLLHNHAVIAEPMIVTNIDPNLKLHKHYILTKNYESDALISLESINVPFILSHLVQFFFYFFIHCVPLPRCMSIEEKV